MDATSTTTVDSLSSHVLTNSVDCNMSLTVLLFPIFLIRVRQKLKTDTPINLPDFRSFRSLLKSQPLWVTLYDRGALSNCPSHNNNINLTGFYL